MGSKKDYSIQSVGMDSIPPDVKEIDVVDTGKFLSTTPPSTFVMKVTCGSVGELLGALVSVGASVGELVGGSVGASVGTFVGLAVGLAVGSGVGF